ncbi:unnamed protein product [Moneuplotes crassus]|uniref:NAD-dependent epimerase/dehydratase domain-containing protein n=1 Tax=Euplotes crassus TaxID=5936 RepID=A0AAD1URT1_EUPCR|nr:unnamed protein product [Moneuplotes crassus]
MEGSPKILITGITGFKGSWIAKKFLSFRDFMLEGKHETFEIRGLVRNLKDPSTIAQLRNTLAKFDGNSEKFPWTIKNKKSTLEFVEGDLFNPDSLKEAVKDCDYVFHAACPAIDEDDEAKSLLEAMEANLNIIKACAYTKVKKLIIVSSYITIARYDKFYCSLDEKSSPKNSKGMNLYEKCRFQAERWAFNYLSHLDAKDRQFSVSFLNPGILFGPLLVPRQDHSAVKFVKRIMMNDLEDDWHPIYYPHCDIRDLADACISCIYYSEDLQRYALTSDTHKLSEYARCISEEFNIQDFEINIYESCKCFVWAGSWFNVEYSNALYRWNKKVHIKSTKAQTELEMDFLDLKTSIIDMCYSLINNGMVTTNDLPTKLLIE